MRIIHRGIVGSLVVAALAVGALTVAPATSAWARGDGWQPLPFSDYDAACGDTVVHVTSAADKEYYREFDLPGDVVEQQITGRLVITYSTDAGASVTVNASGPGRTFAYPNGDFQVVAQGLNSFTFSEEQAATLGVPQISVSAGSMDVTFHPDGTVSGHMGNIIEDVCAELT